MREQSRRGRKGARKLNLQERPPAATAAALGRPSSPTVHIIFLDMLLLSYPYIYGRLSNSKVSNLES